MRQGYAIIRLSELPPSVNSMFVNRTTGKGRGRFKSKQYQQWLTLAGIEIIQQRPGFVPGPYALTLAFGRRNKRADLDNVIKAVNDILVAYQVVSDDALCRKIVAEWVTEPGVHIMVASTKEVGE